MSQISLGKKRIQVGGEFPGVGQVAPAFELVDVRLKQKTLADFSDMPKLISIVPSIDTETCARSTQHINEISNRAYHCLLISADLPFAQQRFCETNALTNIKCLSTFRAKSFAKDYGVLMTDGLLQGLCARALFVLSHDNHIQYAELVSDLSHEPQYESAIEVLNELVEGKSNVDI